jgi:hypothetical protein
VTFQPPPSDEDDVREPAAHTDLPQPQRPAVDQVAAIKAVALSDWALLALGVATLIFSCFDFYHFTSNYAGDKGFSAWHDIAGGGFFGWFGVILPVMATVVMALALFEPDAGFPLDPRLIALYGWGAGFICELLAIVLHPKFYNDSFSGGAHRELGHGFSFFVVLGLTLVGTVVALMRAQQARTDLPGALKALPKIGRS